MRKENVPGGPAESPEQIIYEFLRNNGNHRMNVDGSVSAVSYEYQAPPGDFVFYRVNIHIEDEAILWEQFGGLAALSNGVRIQILDDDGTIISNIDAGHSINSNGDWIYLAGVDVNRQAAGAGNDILEIRWTVAAAGAPMYLEAGRAVRFLIQDDLTGLVEFEAMVQGLLLHPR